MEKIMELALKEKVKSLIPVMGQIVDIRDIPKISQWWKPSPNNF
jgi:hypothetical protein